MSPRLLVLAAGIAGLSACTWSRQTSGYYHWGADLRDARLEAIAKDPSDAGTDEAMARWIALPDSALAQAAVVAAIPTATGPLEARFGELTAAQQRLVFDKVGSTGGDEAMSALVLRLFPSLSPEVRGSAIASLAGRQDPTAVEGLSKLAREGSDLDVRSLAIGALKPADTPTARQTLITLATTSSEPEALRIASIVALRPAEHPDIRGALVKLAGGEDGPVGVALESLGTPRDDAEIEAGLAGTKLARVAPAATAFLGRLADFPPKVTARLHELATAEEAATRWEAATALVAHDDAVGGPPLVGFLDDEARRKDARDRLDKWELQATAPLRSASPALTTPAGKAAAVELLVDVGGPDDAERMRLLGADAATIARLSAAPYGLYPDGKARWGDAVSLKPVAAPLPEAVRAARARDVTGDPGLAFFEASRAWAAGGRSDAGRAAAIDAATASKATFALYVEVKAQITGIAGDVLGSALPVALGNGVAAPIKVQAPATAAIPRMRIEGALRCDDDFSKQAVPGMSERESYTYHVPNPEKEVARRYMEGIPDEISECYRNCYESGYFRYSQPVASDGGICTGSSSGNMVCHAEVRRVANPAYQEASSYYSSVPAELEMYYDRHIARTAHTETTVTRCEGTLEAVLGDRRVPVPISYSGTRRETWVQRVAEADELPTGEPLPALDERVEHQTSDRRREDLQGLLVQHLGSVRISEAEVRALYADAVAPAVAAGDARAARDTLLWSRPDLHDIDGAAFREVLAGSGPAAFPFVGP